MTLDGVLLVDENLYLHHVFDFDVVSGILNELDGEDSEMSCDGLSPTESAMLHIFIESMMKRTIDADKIESEGKMIEDSDRRMLRTGPSLKNHGKRADFSIESTRSHHVLYALEAKSSRNNSGDDLVKLAKMLKRCHSLHFILKQTLL
ncbi:hypothetical protein K501DRAFT_270502 [Backusella circina FSU 941]|nr:hypothetical protein K501DRAFT_270502 [Backusella circina FSU 941]